jgi:hypothetical protein
MSKKYTIVDKKVLRGDEVVATINGDDLDFLEGMAKYRIHAVKAFKASKNATPAPVKKAPVKKVEAKKSDWRSRLSEIIGVEVPLPDYHNGYRRMKVGAIMKKKYNEIVNSTNLTAAEKSKICKLFI